MEKPTVTLYTYINKKHKQGTPELVARTRVVLVIIVVKECSSSSYRFIVVSMGEIYKSYICIYESRGKVYATSIVENTFL